MTRELTRKLLVWVAAGSALGIAGLVVGARADEPGELKVNHSDCSYFGAERENYIKEARDRFARSRQTVEVVRMLGAAPASRPTDGAAKATDNPFAAGDQSDNLIDQNIFPALKAAGVNPAPKTNDYEFIRRVTLDLTGRIPTADRVQAFVADTASNKRSKLVDELLNRPEWVDKWTMYYGDKLKNTSNKVAVRMYDGGRDAFYLWIKNSLANKKPYDQMAREIISARGTNSYDPQQGAINWLVGGRVVNGPQQDIWDAQASDVAETFLGISHINCLECHDGRRHLDNLSLWGKSTTRYQAWQLSSFFSHSNETQTPVDPTVPNGNRYWSIVDDVRPYTTDYALNTTTGNRPPRTPVGTDKTVAPNYFFTGDAPGSGENYRDALARMVTSDFQFARATVNYIWAEFMGRGIVNPTNQFDLARLDPDNPPPDPWTLQPSNPALLNALAKDFIAHGYDIRYLMKVITTSETYQLSSRWDGDWKPEYEPLFARHLIRRLWGEEVMDALSQSSYLFPNYTVTTFKFNYAMQAPEPLTISRGNNILTSFMPGNRDDQPRRLDGSIQEALAMLNDAQVMNRTRATGTAANGSLLARLLPMTPSDMVDAMYLAVLSRPATDAEKAAALANLGSGNRQQKAEDLLWSLYNKVDFLFNY